MSQSELVKRVAETLDRLKLPFMITGSLASSIHGEPRQSHDIDLVIKLPPESISDLLAAFPSSAYYLSEASIQEAVQRGGMFNLLAFDSGDKVDFWMLTDEPFDQSRFQRRTRQPLLGLLLPTSTAEDTILAKLRWDQMCGGSEKQFGDARGIFEVQGDVLDFAYLDAWAARLGVADRWSQLRQGG